MKEEQKTQLGLGEGELLNPKPTILDKKTKLGIPAVNVGNRENSQQENVGVVKGNYKITAGPHDTVIIKTVESQTRAKVEHTLRLMIVDNDRPQPSLLDLAERGFTAAEPDQPKIEPRVIIQIGESYTAKQIIDILMHCAGDIGKLRSLAVDLQSERNRLSEQKKEQANWIKETNKIKESLKKADVLPEGDESAYANNQPYLIDRLSEGIKAKISKHNRIWQLFHYSEVKKLNNYSIDLIKLKGDIIRNNETMDEINQNIYRTVTNFKALNKDLSEVMDHIAEILLQKKVFKNVAEMNTQEIRTEGSMLTTEMGMLVVNRETQIREGFRMQIKNIKRIIKEFKEAEESLKEV